MKNLINKDFTAWLQARELVEFYATGNQSEKLLCELGWACIDIKKK